MVLLRLLTVIICGAWPSQMAHHGSDGRKEQEVMGGGRLHLNDSGNRASRDLGKGGSKSPSRESRMTPPGHPLVLDNSSTGSSIPLSKRFARSEHCVDMAARCGGNRFRRETLTAMP
jgi:hypothetical protein